MHIFMPMQIAPDEEYDWVVRYQSRIRVAPLIAGGVGIVGVLTNRLVSGVMLCRLLPLAVIYHLSARIVIPAGSLH